MKRCVHCGDVIDTDDWYPVTTTRDGGPTIQLRAFCDETCQDGWEAETS